MFELAVQRPRQRDVHGLDGADEERAVASSSQCASVQLKCDDTWFTGSAPNGSGTAAGGVSSSDYVYPCSHVFSNVTSTVSCGCTT